ncbi:MAG TPA: polyhydroxyalkanoate depolymerase, partial [Pseudonocardia sp.]|nr:polyhydroxyalkanoate depolymerase [Pseudonocardia sp.]
MLYAAYEAQRVTLDGARAASRAALGSLDLLPPPIADLDPVRRLRAAHQVFIDSAITHERLPFGIDKVGVETPTGVRAVAVHEQVVTRTPFCTLLRFAKDLPEGAPPQPRVLVVAPLSGHFATLLTDTVRTLLPDHDVHVTDWHNARDVGLEHGPFGLDEVVDHVVEFLQALGPRSHVMAVCQPCVPVLAAVALLAEDRNVAQPASMTLVAGPVDVAVSPTPVNTLARSGPPEWFRDTVVTTVPPPYAGAGRRVYPGFLQLAGFVAMNPKRHLDAHLGLFEALVAGDDPRARSTRDFYDEYLAVSDLPAEVYLETISQIFQGNLLARGEYTWRGRRVRPERII